MKVLSGLYKPSNGSLYFEGNEEILNSPKDSQNLGLARNYVDNNRFMPTANLIEEVGEIRSQGNQEVRMIKRYKDLLEVDDAGCPTCGQDIDSAFIQAELEKHQVSKQEYVDKLDYTEALITKMNEDNSTRIESLRVPFPIS